MSVRKPGLTARRVGAWAVKLSSDCSLPGLAGETQPHAGLTASHRDAPLGTHVFAPPNHSSFLAPPPIPFLLPPSRCPNDRHCALCVCGLTPCPVRSPDFPSYMVSYHPTLAPQLGSPSLQPHKLGISRGDLCCPHLGSP